MIATCDDDRLHKISVSALHPNYTFIASLCKEKVNLTFWGMFSKAHHNIFGIYVYFSIVHLFPIRFFIDIGI